MSNITLEIATDEQLAQMLAIYAPYVQNTTVSSEYEPPSIEEFAHRLHEYGRVLPWLCCVQQERVLAYGYASPHRSRAGYQWSVETSIYVDAACHRAGLARRIYSALFEILRLQGYYNIYVGISIPNEKSIRFHEAMGFVASGAYQSSMFKHGAWHDVLWMGKRLRTHTDAPVPPTPFSALRDSLQVQQILARV